jgi:hypothetical protein
MNRSGNDVDISIILPIDVGSNGTIEHVVSSYAEWLDASEYSWEMLIAPVAGMKLKGAGLDALMRITKVRICQSADGWGGAVNAGLRASSGEMLCYTNWRRTSVDVLSEMLSLAMRNRDVVLRANRRTRDTRIGRMGSLLYNIECRLLLQVAAWDINGTPKIFPRVFTDLLHLTQSGNLLDAEFAAVCERSGYPVMEVPVEASLAPGLSEAFQFRSALQMYAGVIKLRAQLTR